MGYYGSNTYERISSGRAPERSARVHFVCHARGPWMGRVSHSWREPWASALAESDPSKVLGRIEYAIATIERRYAEWESDPGTPAELKAIQKAIFPA